MPRRYQKARGAGGTTATALRRIQFQRPARSAPWDANQSAALGNRVRHDPIRCNPVRCKEPAPNPYRRPVTRLARPSRAHSVRPPRYPGPPGRGRWVHPERQERCRSDHPERGYRQRTELVRRPDSHRDHREIRLAPRVPILAGTAHLAHDLGCEQFQMVEVGGIKQLQIHPLHAGFGEWAQTVDDLGRRAGERSVGAKLIDISRDRIGTPGDLSLVAPSTHGERRRVDDVVACAAYFA